MVWNIWSNETSRTQSGERSKTTEIRDYYRSLIDCLPLETVDFAFAYGSGALQQAEENKSDKMVDFILVSRDSLKFHNENLLRNHAHYSCLLGLRGAEKITAIQFLLGRLIKYGIISMEDFRDDLLNWYWLYVAGRLHKPVLDVIMPPQSSSTDFSAIPTILAENRRAALDAALLQLSDKFSLEDLFIKIASHSYVGDIRMGVAEDRNKIQKLVSGAMNEFAAIYLPFLQNDPRAHVSGTTVEQDIGTTAIYHRLNLLPFTVQNELQRQLVKEQGYLKGRCRDVEEDLFALAHKYDINNRVGKAIEQIVVSSSRSQTLKNARTAGLYKSAIYSYKKFTKLILSVVRK